MTTCKNPCVRALALALLLATVAAPLAAKQNPENAAPKTPQPAAQRDGRFEISYLDLHAAEQLAWEQCQVKERCEIATLTSNGSAAKGLLMVTADPATLERISHALAKADAAPRTQSFRILLLSASTKGGAGGAGNGEVPENAKKAMDDLRRFLPYKSYQLLDSGWMRATQDRPSEGRLVGRGDDEYKVKLRFRTTGNDDLFVDAFALTLAVMPPRDLISTSFSLKVGETLVVGTSKIDGSDEAMVVLLTAVPQG